MWNMITNCTCSKKWDDIAPLALRVALGAIFMYHGYMKVFVMGMPAVTGFFASIGIPFAGLMAPLVAYVELIGGAFLIVGFLTHWTAKAGVIIAIVAFLTVHMSKGFDISK
ncbi:MAG: putative oxidoreductase CatD, partial [Candidatus Parcubacteria bacterium]